ncbi:MAG: orotidine-5'-phosphate decarboxylase [Bacteroidales bacterium]|nr:orotidine-5'-phosphate decarboxylase [Bacteroidales bacterium]
MTYKEITGQIAEKQSFLCVGLDPDVNQIPEHLKRFDDPVFEFNREIIDATAQYAIAVKPNIAFYECNGIKGWQSLEKTVNYLKKNYPEIFLIADAKRGDIGNTSKMYAQAFFKQMDFDAITVSPYMGKDSIQPFLEFENKWVIILALTSNEGASDFQMLRTGPTDRLYENVVRSSIVWADHNKIMYVVGATKASMLLTIRDIAPDHFLLVPGVGAQGGSLEEVYKYGQNKHCGLLVNSSRGIIFADKTEKFAQVAEAKAKELQEQMKKLLV